MVKDLARNHFKIHTQIYNNLYSYFPPFEDVFDEENFYLFAIGTVVVSILVCFLLSRKVKLTETDF